MTTITSPISITLPRKTKKNRKIALNLNIYRNLHYLVNNQVKNIYAEQILSSLKSLQLNKIRLEFILFIGSNRRSDLSNVCCIVDKFFSDVLVEANAIPDDDVKHIPEVTYKFGGIDKDNPRCEVNIIEL